MTKRRKRADPSQVKILVVAGSMPKPTETPGDWLVSDKKDAKPNRAGAKRTYAHPLYSSPLVLIGNFWR